MRKLFAVFTLLVSIVWCSMAGEKSKSPFVTVKNGQFIVDGQPYYYVGTNFWFGGILGSEGEGGNQERLLKELDFMKSKGINNLRVLVGADGAEAKVSKVQPALQTAPGEYDQALFKGLDFLLAEMGKRGMYAILYLNNSWEWSGGYSQYLEWSGHGKAPIPATDGWGAFQDYVTKYAKSKPAQQLFSNHIENVLSRINSYTKVAYKDDPTIMAWQIGNEPRAFGNDNKEAFQEWLAQASALIKSLDSNHLLSVGSEGSSGCEGDIELWRTIHADENIDYCTIHIWPNNWGWLNKQDMAGTIDGCIEKTLDYINRHDNIAQQMGIPMVLEEFGFPRDNMKFENGTPTTFRDQYYGAVFDRIVKAANVKGCFAGCNFWAWAGFARPSADNDAFWKTGEDYMGDPAQEEQGLNSVYDTDTTVALIKEHTKKLSSVK